MEVGPASRQEGQGNLIKSPVGAEALGNPSFHRRQWVQRHAGGEKESTDAATVGRKLEGSGKYISVHGSSTMLAATRWGARRGEVRNVLFKPKVYENTLAPPEGGAGDGVD